MEEYINQLISEKQQQAGSKGLAQLTPPEHERLAATLQDKLNEQIETAVLLALPKEDLDRLTKGLEDGSMSGGDVAKLIEDSPVNIEQISKQVAEKFKEFFLNMELGGDK